MLDKLVPYYGWIKWGAIAIAFVGYTYVVYQKGVESEYVNHLKTINTNKQEVIDLKTKQVDDIIKKIDIFNKGAENFNKNETVIKQIAREIHTETIKEIEKPIYTECVISKEQFDLMNSTIDKYNGVAK